MDKAKSKVQRTGRTASKQERAYELVRDDGYVIDKITLKSKTLNTGFREAREYFNKYFTGNYNLLSFNMENGDVESKRVALSGCPLNKEKGSV